MSKLMEEVDENFKNNHAKLVSKIQYSVQKNLIVEILYIKG